MSFEDCEISVVELKNIMFRSLIHGHRHTIVCIFLVFLNFWIFLFLYIRGSLLYIFYVFGLCPSALSNEIESLLKKL